MRKLNYAQVSDNVSASGYMLLTEQKDYLNTRQKLRVKCKCGEIVETTLSNLRKMQGCSMCCPNKERSFSKIEKAFRDAGCVLLTKEDLYSAQSAISYVCQCGKTSSIRATCFLMGQRCFECGKKKRQGINHRYYKQGYKIKGDKNPNWNPNLTDEERTIRQYRGNTEYKEWRTSIFRRDGFLCCKCKVRNGDINAHHILNFSEHRNSRFDIDNGITLCKQHHDEFHKIYGKQNNNRQQLEEYIKCVT